jgi:hypothetical protein
MEPFDLLFYRGKGIVSKAVKQFSDSPYSHVALVLDEYHLLEANWNHPLSIRHISYRRSDYDVYRVVGLEERQKEKIREYIQQTINAGYDYRLVISHVFHYFFKGKLIHDENRFDCSEWIDLAFMYAGVNLLPYRLDSLVTPGELADSDKLILVKP